ncbi:MAG: CDP-diacylglycerol--glycerol-3-phosphate 3-phosphatidyltransferase [SAR86 cluster bacterium]|uniref:CDP-diacylglycerol--glycerol-3-phosphate 3-phosphatidyltransferase n=1 Tax=SAR86 cluster bacterium TaxID=2030880 RepID=A0A2A4X2R3_9GAMM|nr:MAG: CDP-diacylglycerol--glycerol-3-phosphate 3-phosphatidyltransferase [SAR86 cluster bacterium]
MNWANIATISRVVLIPVVIYCYNLDTQSSHLLAAILFSIASLTDWLDGYLARKLDQTSEFGAFLDPVADKLLVAIIVIMLVSVYPALLLAGSIIIAREILVSALREWMAAQGLRDKVAVAFSGKLKTTVQMLAIITLLLANPSLPEWVLMLGYALIYLAAVLSISSGMQYFRAALGEQQSKS